MHLRAESPAARHRWAAASAEVGVTALATAVSDATNMHSALQAWDAIALQAAAAPPVSYCAA
jgi:hypothetical protein